ncbi:MAG: single-stranded DNA-binding protein [Clostridia bacterium]|nr:single-stranded DNA-binding protein [Clostridia bacterium]MBQ2378333.1 single-stranded DNA-binding protein [Clostridia bacterium]MBQ5764371.1 single-stranded DNA-binding protein [Ruminococcus sp.]
MANFNFNKVMIGGRLTADPENSQTTSGISMTRFSVAVNRRFAKDSSQQQTDFFNVTAWRATADFVSKYFKKGSSIFITGSLQTRSWTDQNGQKRYATDIVAEEVSFVDSRSESSSSGQYVPDSYNAEPSFSGGAEAPKFEEIKGDDDLPF